jgi:hypothetical protein
MVWFDWIIFKTGSNLFEKSDAVAYFYFNTKKIIKLLRDKGLILTAKPRG